MFDILLPLDLDASILEPSAGQGAIIQNAIEYGCVSKEQFDCIEIHPLNRAALEEQGLNLIAENFNEFQTDKRYDSCYANPPFKEILSHTLKISEILKKNGSAVIVVPSSFKDKYEKQIAELEEQYEYVGFYEVPNGSFKELGTMVNCDILHLSYKL